MPRVPEYTAQVGHDLLPDILEAVLLVRLLQVESPPEERPDSRAVEVVENGPRFR